MSKIFPKTFNFANKKEVMTAPTEKYNTNQIHSYVPSGYGIHFPRSVKGISILLCIMMLSFFSGARAQSKPGVTLTGNVTDDKGKPVEVANIVINSSLYTLSDDKGNFKITGVPTGEVEYYASCLGYREARGKLTVKGDGRDRLTIRLVRLDLSLGTVTVTARQQAMGSKSLIDQDAVRHIQPKSLADMLQLMPGALTVNPTLNNLAQANIREIDGNDNNALGTAIVLDGTPISNDANLQAIAPTRSGKASSTAADGMSDQTTAGRGTDLRTISADNIESVEVIRGIPSVEYGNLTSGVVVVKTKSGKSPLEAKFKADPFSKLVYAGKGFALGKGTMNVGLDWSQSWADTRRHYMGYDRITGTVGYSTIFNLSGGKPMSFNVNGSFYSNINNFKHDPQMAQLDLKYKNSNVGGRLALHGHAQLDSWLTGFDYDVAAQVARTLDSHYDLVASPDGVISTATTSGEHSALIVDKAYYSDYKIEGIPVNIYAQFKANKYIRLRGRNSFNIKGGLEYRLDDNRGDGLTFDVTRPPKAGEAQSYRPRAFKDIPALHSLSAFLSDASTFDFGATSLQFEAGLRLSDLLLSKDKSGESNIFVAEPRANAEYTFLTKKNNSLFDKLSISGGFGISNKMPTLLYIYPDRAYFDNVSVSAIASDMSRIAAMTTSVVDKTHNPDLKPARSTKWELGLNARIGKFKGYVNFFSELHRNEFGFDPQFILLKYNTYNIPTGASNLLYTEGKGVTYTIDGVTASASTSPATELQLWSRPSNTMRTYKHGIEYSLDFGTFKPLSTSLVIDGAWFHIRRKSDVNSLNYISYQYDYIPLMPAGSGTVSDRVNSNFRFITHIPAVKLVFTTTMQVVWYENTRSIYESRNGKKLYHLSADGSEYIVSPLGFYDREGKWNEWQPSNETLSKYSLMNGRYFLYSFKSDRISPWVLFNFRLTKELGTRADISFMANNFLGIKKYHTDRNTLYKQQLYPSSYFGAELKLKF